MNGFAPSLALIVKNNTAKEWLVMISLLEGGNGIKTTH